jgi:hypothetical protein
MKTESGYFHGISDRLIEAALSELAAWTPEARNRLIRSFRAMPELAEALGDWLRLGQAWDGVEAAELYRRACYADWDSMI